MKQYLPIPGVLGWRLVELLWEKSGGPRDGGGGGGLLSDFDRGGGKGRFLIQRVIYRNIRM